MFLVYLHYGISETTMAITQQEKSLQDPCHLLLFLAYEGDESMCFYHISEWLNFMQFKN